ncbi:MAG: NAD(P)-dependent oxidoreductase [Bacteroidia bacterium]
MDIFFYEAFEEEEEAIKHYLPDHIKAGFTWKTIQEYGSDTPPAPVISLRTQSVIPDEWASSLQAILSRSTGYDHLRAYRERVAPNLSLGYLPLYCHRAVAEQAMLLWMSLLRKLPQQLEHFTRFHRDGLTGRETAEKTLLVVGVGNIGYEVIRIGNGLDMKTLGVDLNHEKEDVNYVSLEDGLAQADICVCAMDLTHNNVGFFSYDVLKKAKPGMLFINISRGELSHSSVLIKLLEEGHLGGVGIDVYEQEKSLAGVLREGIPSDHPEVQATLAMSRHPKAICTPHNAFNSEEGVGRKSSQSVEQIEAFLKNGRFIWQAP